MFLNPHFTFNGIYSKDMNVCIASMDNDLFNDIGISYSSNLEVETNLIEYNPYFVENPSEADEIELNLLLYDPNTIRSIPINEYDMDTLLDWLITDNFAPFISDDDKEIIYYFKVVKLSKVLTFNKRGYLNVTFKPYSKYCYKRKEYTSNVSGTTNLDIYNDSKLIYKPIIELTNLGNISTVNKINNMEITGLETNETIRIDNLTKVVLDNNNNNKFSCCNAKWIEFKPRVYNNLTISGNCSVKVICEFPIIY